MSWFWTIIIFLINFTFSINLSEANHQKKLPSAVVVGTVYCCDKCFHKDSPKTSYFIAGASIAIECNDTSSRPISFGQGVKTNKHGEFKIHLPFSVNKHVKKIKLCSVRLISSNHPFCSVPAKAISSSLHLKSRKEGKHIFSAGLLTFEPIKQSQTCDHQNPIISNNPMNTENDDAIIPLPPNPLFNPPPSLIIIPFQPPPASVIPPIFPTPPPPSLFPPLFPSPPTINLPPIPGLIPSPPPPPPPAFPIPLPPFPFQPTPGFPGVPPEC